MDEERLAQLRDKNPERVKQILEEFNTKNAELFNFDAFRAGDQWPTLWKAVFNVLTDAALCDLHVLCLYTVRILSRDEFSVQKHDIIGDLDFLLKMAQFTLPKSTTARCEVEPASSIELMVQSLKCICNLVFQSGDCRRECLVCKIPDAILKRVRTTNMYPPAVELFDMKLLFLMTALEPAARNNVTLESNGLTYMTVCLEEKLSEVQCSDEQLDVLLEMLKVMFNLTTSPDKSPNECELQNLRITIVMRKLLLRFGYFGSERERNVVAHVVNLLTNMSNASLFELVTKCEESEADIAAATSTGAGAGAAAISSSDLVPLLYESWNLRALDVLLQYLRLVLDEQEHTASSDELISPVLAVLAKCVRCDRLLRHYIRSVVLPPLRNASKRPEVGHELRNHLCRFLTLPSIVVRDLAAELLFVCCKENVARMIKYTGYGNAAGLLAKRGLLDCRRVQNADYSSDSEDSDTEEYKQQVHGINPVLGCYEPPKSNPLEGMSEEQKEYEAVELAKLIDKLHRSGIVQPCLIGEDGKPQPVDHILQLQEELPQQQFDQKQKT